MMTEWYGIRKRSILCPLSFKLTRQVMEKMEASKSFKFWLTKVWVILLKTSATR